MIGDGKVTCLKILFITPVYHPAWEYGGIVPALKDQIARLHEIGNNVVIVTTDACNKIERIKKNCENNEGLKIIRFRNLINLLAWQRIFIPIISNRKLKKIISESDIIHIVDYRFLPNYFISNYAIKNDIPYVITPLNPFKEYSRKKLLKSLFDRTLGKDIINNASAVFAENEVEKQSYISKGLDDKKIAVNPHIIDTNSLIPHNVYDIKQIYNIPRESKLIVYLGRIDHVKGTDILVKAFSKALNNINEKKTFLLIAGPDAGFKNKVVKLINLEHLNDRIIFTGPVLGDLKLSILLAADVVVVPSRHEEFGRVPVEAFALGIPVIVTQNCGVNLWMKDYFDKIVLTEDEMSDAIVYVLNNNIKNSLSKEARKNIVEELFSWKKTILLTLKIYEDAISSKKTKSINN